MSRPARRAMVCVLAAWPGLALPGWAWAGQDPDAVSAAVRQAAQMVTPPDATISLGPVNGAKYMQACTAPLGVNISGVAPYEQAAVHCPAPGWTLYVSVTVAQSEAVVVTAHPVVAGQTLAAGDLVMRREPVQLFAGRQIYADPAQLVGASVMMSLAAGMVITQDSVQAPLVIKAGQTVTVQVISGGVLLSVNAVAQQAGRIGDTVLLTNPSSGRRFSAEVTAHGPVVQLQ
ncbi:flagellar basal body P-ring formation chaperone FlgA [Acidocella aromatica]|uniref:Flagella basal body P-ring formation protein FlgA n=1 Tax=Acidocella aromatica TaxID=1303579 RepID=A0A840VCZ9_9PROT|nr:flagellar basal body P-ring formation chaperone FlgA [Acidocella aromatica]MBB5373758.1 flagella basal body P-ring formation protein FlgA [Acidocella aromatica]